MSRKIIHTKSDIALVVQRRRANNALELQLEAHIPQPCLLHWGICGHFSDDWKIPPKSLWPEGTQVFNETAVQTPFMKHNNSEGITFKIDTPIDIAYLAFALFFPSENRWDNNDGKNYKIKLQTLKSASDPAAALKENLNRKTSLNEHVYQIEDSHQLAVSLSKDSEEIISKETGGQSWTLMHRFNLCRDLLDKGEINVEKLVLIFVWMRFSAIRQLDWQRNYNTQPRELSHAQDRLTNKLADLYIDHPAGRFIIRLILTTLGRGGEGQRVRDEILNIMHRHHIKEVSGHFMEEWHQKLHNNTTPDDVALCEAYLAFLRDDGNLDVFYHKLEQAGVTKKRLESYDRPIKSHPDFIGHLKDALIHDFEVFLGILKEVHSGTDLGVAIHTSRSLLDPEMHERLDYIWWHRDDGPSDICALVEKITAARKWISYRIKTHTKGIRELLFLDLALEDFLRLAVERNLHLKLTENQLVDLISLMIQNRLYTDDDKELSLCLQHWNILKDKSRLGKQWSLQAQAVIERLERILGGFIDRYYMLIQPKADFLGRAFNSDAWAISLFTEEVVRGRPTFVLVLLLRHLYPVLRKKANLGNWQVVSRGEGLGRVEVTDNLGAVQNKRYQQATVIVADKISGNEEIPQGITAIITPDTTDIVSHVAIRARNAHVLIATCFEPKTVRTLKSLEGQNVKLHVNTAGEVTFEITDKNLISTRPVIKTEFIRGFEPTFKAYALCEKDFNDENVGAKSNNLRRLRRNNPDGIALPGSVALPFGVFEKILFERQNKIVTEQYQHLIRQLQNKPGGSEHDFLDRLRTIIMKLIPPEGLSHCLDQVMEDSGLAKLKSWDKTWTCIKRVWSSKWNERAYLSRKANAIAHEDIHMAVLIQEVVETEYSFVIHTKNPFTNDKNEMYAEVVMGLGETLVGNYPGRAFGFCIKKDVEKPLILSIPSKSIGMFGKGHIFRSDSNGEDLGEYAGAGLYDSIMLPPPETKILDYTGVPIVWDKHFQKDFSVNICRIGKAIEKIMGSPQDIEGAYANGKYFVVQTRPQV